MVFLSPHEVVGAVCPQVTVLPVAISHRKLRLGPGIYDVEHHMRPECSHYQGSGHTTCLLNFGPCPTPQRSPSLLGLCPPGSLENVEETPEEGLERPPVG